MQRLSEHKAALKRQAIMDKNSVRGAASFKEWVDIVRCEDDPEMDDHSRIANGAYNDAAEDAYRLFGQSPWTRPDPDKPDSLPEVGQEIDVLSGDKVYRGGQRIEGRRMVADQILGIETSEGVVLCPFKVTFWAPAGTLPTMEGE